MVGRCAVPGCKTTYYKGNQKENDVTLFAVPKTSLSKWQELIPCSNLTSTSRICSRHFDESDFKSGIEIFNVFHPFQRRHLNAGAIPKHFLINGMYFLSCKIFNVTQKLNHFHFRYNLADKQCKMLMVLNGEITLMVFLHMFILFNIK
jgi:hypothetical protein